MLIFTLHYSCPLIMITSVAPSLHSRNFSNHQIILALYSDNSNAMIATDKGPSLLKLEEVKKSNPLTVVIWNWCTTKILLKITVFIALRAIGKDSRWPHMDPTRRATHSWIILKGGVAMYFLHAKHESNDYYYIAGYIYSCKDHDILEHKCLFRFTKWHL